MSSTLDSLTAQALALPPEQRIGLAERLWRSVEGTFDDDDELIAEIERREAEVASGVVQPIPFDRAMREIRESLK
jgi:putative addiction module component (TIGR02574 family)